MYLIFVDPPHFLRTIWQLSIYKFHSKAVISFMLIHHTETRVISLYAKLYNICETKFSIYLYSVGFWIRSSVHVVPGWALTSMVCCLLGFSY